MKTVKCNVRKNRNDSEEPEMSMAFVTEIRAACVFQMLDRRGNRLRVVQNHGPTGASPAVAIALLKAKLLEWSREQESQA
jgi:hypothetical protein